MIISAIPDCIHSSILEQINLLINTSITNIDLRRINDTNITCLSSKELDDAERMLSFRGIKVNTLCSIWGKKKFSSFIDPKEEIVELQKCFDIAEQLNCKSIRVFAYLCQSADKAKVQHFISNEILRYFSKSNIRLCFENEKGTAFEIVEDFQNLKKLSKAENVKMIFDIANFIDCGYSWEKDINMCLPFIESVHIRDICKDNPGESVRLGQGDCFKKILLDDFLKCNKLNLVYEPKLQNNDNKEEIFRYDIAKLCENFDNV